MTGEGEPLVVPLLQDQRLEGREVAQPWAGKPWRDSERFSLFDSEPDIKYSADGVAVTVHAWHAEGHL